MSNSKTEAQCPECKTWHPVRRMADADEDFGWWWAEPAPLTAFNSSCPSCDSTICVEAECEFRHAVYSGASPREFVRWDAVDCRELETEAQS